MAVFKKNGNWWIDIYLQGRRVRRKIGPDKRTAQLTEQDLKVKAAKGEWLGIQAQKERITFQRFFQDVFLPRHAKNAEGTLIGYRSAFRKHFKKAFGNLFLDQIRPERIEDYVAGRLADAKPSTVNKERAYLQAIFGAAERWHHIPDNPVSKVSKLKVPERRFSVLTPEEVRQLMNESTDWFRVFIGVALNTGMRREEMRQLKWSNVDLRKRQVTVALDGDFITKTRRNRTIPMNSFLCDLLSKHPRHITNPYVFPSPNKEGMPRDRDAFGPMLTQLLDDLGLPHYRVHDLRHAFGTTLAVKGVDPRTIMELMGHTNIEMTMRYIHTSAARKVSAVENLGLDGRQEDGEDGTTSQSRQTG